MSLNAPRFITPPTDDQERFPFRSVWQSLIIETLILIAVIVIVYALTNVFNIAIPAKIQQYAVLGLAVTPYGLWLTFSWFAERRAPQPRRHLIAVTILTMLVANSVGTPLISKYFQVDNWLPLAPAVNRIIGYTLTVGITQELIKYLVLRYTIWPGQLRVRLDGIAYGIAAGIGYATILNIQFIVANVTAPPDVIAFRMFANYAIHIATGLVIGYGLAEVYFSDPSPLFQIFTLIVAAIITGIAIPIHAGLVNASLSITSISAPKPLFGFGFSAALLIMVGIIIAGLIRNADRLERESQASDED